MIILFPVATICILLILNAIPKAVRDTGDAVIDTGTGAVDKSYETVKKIAQDIAAGIDSVIHVRPQVTYKGTMLLGANIPIVELATVEQSTQYEYEWEHEWLKSKKKIRITGTLIAKAGFKLDDYFELNITEEQGSYAISVYVPQAKLLSLELQPNFEVWSENGWWNKVNDKERNEVINRYLHEAKIYVAHGGILETATENLEERLDNAIKAQLHDTPILYSYERPPRG